MPGLERQLLASPTPAPRKLVDRPGMSGDSTSWERRRMPRVRYGVGNRVRIAPSSSVPESTIGGCVSRPTPIFLWCCELVWERVVEVGRSLVLLREPWIVALSTCRKVLLLTRLPVIRTPTTDFTREPEKWSGWKWCIDGVRASISRKGRQGMRPGSRLGATSDNGERDDLGCYKQRDPGVA
jgi:hypothetical protein